MKKFKDLDFIPHFSGGVFAHMFFDNGYGVSVVKSPGTYGYAQGLYELAVLVGTKDKRELCYKTKITDDVIGYLTPEGVTKYMKDIQLLKTH